MRIKYSTLPEKLDSDYFFATLLTRNLLPSDEGSVSYADDRRDKLTEVAEFVTDNSRYFANLFSGCVELEKIISPLNFSSAFSNQIDNAFKNCKSLKTVSFVGESIKINISFSDSPLLSADSVQSIIDGLAPVTTATTVTFHKDIVLSDEQKQQITDKGWTLVQA